MAVSESAILKLPITQFYSEDLTYEKIFLIMEIIKLIPIYSQKENKVRIVGYKRRTSTFLVKFFREYKSSRDSVIWG